MSAKLALVRNMYRLRRITAEKVWAYVDSGEISAAEAVLICGPKQKQQKI